MISSTGLIAYIEHIGQAEALLQEVKHSQSESHLLIYKINQGMLSLKLATTTSQMSVMAMCGNAELSQIQ